MTATFASAAGSATDAAARPRSSWRGPSASSWDWSERSQSPPGGNAARTRPAEASLPGVGHLEEIKRRHQGLHRRGHAPGEQRRNSSPPASCAEGAFRGCRPEVHRLVGHGRIGKPKPHAQNRWQRPCSDGCASATSSSVFIGPSIGAGPLVGKPRCLCAPQQHYRPQVINKRINDESQRR